MKRKHNGHKKAADKRKVQIVPWFSKAEWEEVYSHLYSSDMTKKAKALDRISAWRARMDNHVPYGIEATATMVRAVVEDEQSVGEKGCQTDTVETLYAMGITRFIAYVYVSGQVIHKLITRAEMTEKLNIPDWIVGIRNQIAHGHLPSLILLRKATKHALTWMQENYWEKELVGMKDVDSSGGMVERSTSVVTSAAPEQVRRALRRYQELKLQRSSNADNHESLKEELQLLNTLVIKSGQVCADVLCEDGFLSMTKYQLQAVTGREFVVEESIDEKVIGLWSPVLSLFLKNRASLFLLKSLLQKLGSSDRITSTLALRWMELIIQSAPDYSGSEISAKKPAKVNWLELLTAAAESPNVHTTRIMECIFGRMKPEVGGSVKDELLKLVRIRVGQIEEDGDLQMEEDGEPRVYTLEDLQQVPSTQQGSWELSTDIAWWKYPVGVIPGQAVESAPELTLPSTATQFTTQQGSCSDCSTDDTELTEPEPTRHDTALQTDILSAINIL